MFGCDQELCHYWTGQGCACAVFGLAGYPERLGDLSPEEVEAPEQYEHEMQT